jgi:hypothetical protein
MLHKPALKKNQARRYGESDSFGAVHAQVPDLAFWRPCLSVPKGHLFDGGPRHE